MSGEFVYRGAEKFVGDKAGEFRKFIASVRSEMKSDLPLYLLTANYLLVVAAISPLGLGSEKFQPFLYLRNWTLVSAGILGLLIYPIAAASVVRAVREDRERPFSAFLRILRGRLTPRLVAGLPLIVALGVFQGVFTSAKDLLPNFGAFIWDKPLAALDKALLDDHDAWVLTAAMIPDGRMLGALNFIYSAVWPVALLASCAYLSVSSAFAHLRIRYLLAVELCWIAVGNILAGLFLSGGPIFYANFTGDGRRYGALAQSIAGTGAVFEKSYLWRAYESGQVWPASGISAFPSVHLVQATLLALLLWSMDRRLGWIGIAFVALIEIGSVRLGWHYAIGGFTAIAFAIFAWWLLGRLWNPSSQLRATKQPSAD